MPAEEGRFGLRPAQSLARKAPVDSLQQRVMPAPAKSRCV